MSTRRSSTYQLFTWRQRQRLLRIEGLEDRRLLSATSLAANAISFADDLIVNTAPSYGKLGEALWQLSESQDGSLFGMNKQELASFILYRGDEIGIEALATSDSNKLVSDLKEKLGISEVTIFGDKVQFWLSRTEIKQLDALSSVKNVGLLSLPMSHVGVATSQGDESQRTDILRLFQRDLAGPNPNDLTGRGISVGVISDSYNLSGNAITAAIDVTTGDLPGPGNPLGHLQPVTVFRDNRSNAVLRSDEGRAMLQIVHDVAPDANLIFSNDAGPGANVIPSELAFAQNITTLWQTQGADIIVDDLIYFAEPMFEEGPVAQAARQAVEAGIVYVSAAGNQAADSYESGYQDSMQNVAVNFNGTVTNFRAHDFDPGGPIDTLQQIVVPPNAVGSPTSISFQWDQPFAGATTNFEIFVFDGITGLPVARGAQLNPLNPVEIVAINNTTVAARPYDILIGVNGALPTGPIDMKYVAFNPNVQIIDFATNSPTAFGHVLADGVIGVGAAEFWQTPEFGFAQPVLAGFSSLGEVNGGVDIVAPQRVNTTFFGQDSPQDADALPNFAGTSAAAPHIAGLAALLLQLNPLLGPGGVETAIKDSAIDMDNPFTVGFDDGVDAATGAGFVDALGAIGIVQDTLQLVGLDPNEYILVNVTNDALDTNPDPNVIDVSPAPGNQISLRAAVINANLATTTQKTILAPKGNYALSLLGAESELTNDLDVVNHVTIVGAGPGASVIDASTLGAGVNSRIFDIRSGASLNLARATVTGGNVSTDSGGAFLVMSGGLLSLDQVSIVGNRAANGGAIRLRDSGSKLSITRSVLTGNTATDGGGVLVATQGASVTIGSSLFARNTAVTSPNLSLAVSGTLVNLGYNLIDNTAGAGTFFSSNFGDHIAAPGSVQFVVTSIVDRNNTVDDATIRSGREAVNAANDLPGPDTIWLPAWRLELRESGVTDTRLVNDLDVTSAMTMVGAGAGLTVIDASPLGGGLHDRVFDVQSGSLLNLSRATITGGYTIPDAGGAFLVTSASLNLDQVSVVRNRAGNGGAIRVVGAGAALAISRSVFTDNTATSSGGAIAATSPVSVTIGSTIFAHNTAPVNPNVGLPAGVTTLNNGHNRIDNKAGAGTFFDTDFLGQVDHVVTAVADTLNHADDAYALSLRDAIDLANADVPLDEVWLPAWNFVLTRQRAVMPDGIAESNATDTDAAWGDLDISKSLIVRGINGVNAFSKVGWRAGIVDAVFDLLGDYNGDGLANGLDNGNVGTEDYSIWRNTLWSQTNLIADGNDNGIVDQADWQIWLSGYGNTLLVDGVV